MESSFKERLRPYQNSPGSSISLRENCSPRGQAGPPAVYKNYVIQLGKGKDTMQLKCTHSIANGNTQMIIHRDQFVHKP